MTHPALLHVIERVRGALADAVPLCIRGGGTKDFYGGALVGEALSTAQLTGITSYEPSELVVTALAGTPLAELEALLAERGQCLPFEPPRFRDGGTIGGMVAAGLSGPARASVGSMRDYVLGATLLNGRAEVLTFGGQVMKNVAGYDVSRVLAGSLGVLGIITEVSLKVLPMAPAEATLDFECGEAEALERLNAWGGRPLPLNASCWTEERNIGKLSVRLRGAVAAVEAACQSLGGQRKDPARAAPDWHGCRDQSSPWFSEKRGTHDLWRLSVPQTAPALPLDDAPLIEWHGGLRWYQSPPGEVKRMRDAARGVGGHAMLFRAAPTADQPTPLRLHAFDELSPALRRVHAALKREFDPVRIFNRGRLQADL